MDEMYGVIYKNVGCFIDKEFVKCVEIIESVFWEIKDAFNLRVDEEGIVYDIQDNIVGLDSEIRGEHAYHIIQEVWDNDIKPELQKL